MDAKDIRALLAGQRDQKFRKQTDSRLSSINQLSTYWKTKWQDEEFRKKKIEERKSGSWRENVAASNRRKAKDPTILKKVRDNMVKSKGTRVAVLSIDSNEWMFFETATDASKYYKISTWASSPVVYFPDDGSIKYIHKGKCKGYLLRRIVNDDNNCIDPNTKIYTGKDKNTHIAIWKNFDRKNPPTIEYSFKQEKIAANAMKCVTPFGEFNSIGAACKYAKENNLFSNAEKKIRNRIKDNNFSDYYVKNDPN